MSFIGIKNIDELIKIAQEDLSEAAQEFSDNLDILEHTLDGEANIYEGYGSVDATTYISKDTIFEELFEYDSIESIIKSIYRKLLEESNGSLREIIYNSIIENISDNSDAFDSQILREHMPFKYMDMVLKEIKEVDMQGSGGTNIPTMLIKMHFDIGYKR